MGAGKYMYGDLCDCIQGYIVDTWDMNRYLDMSAEYAIRPNLIKEIGQH